MIANFTPLLFPCLGLCLPASAFGVHISGIVAELGLQKAAGGWCW